MVLWIVASFVVRGTIAASLGGGTSIYGPLSAPIVLLIWLYTLAIAVLIGAAANASIRELYPHEEQRSLHDRLGAWIGELRQRRTAREERPAGWDDPFDGYGTVGDDDLGLSGLREAARGPLTPMSGAGRSTPVPPPECPVDAGRRVDAEH
jgi:membrane protein